MSGCTDCAQIVDSRLNLYYKKILPEDFIRALDTEQSFPFLQTVSLLFLTFHLTAKGAAVVCLRLSVAACGAVPGW